MVVPRQKLGVNSKTVIQLRGDTMVLRCLVAGLTALTFSPANANDPAPKPTPLNANIYLASENKGRFSDTVKEVRDLESGVEVVFLKFGVYPAPEDGVMMERLLESRKLKAPVTVEFNEDSRKILKVGKPTPPETKSPTAPAGAGPSKGSGFSK